MQLGCLIYGPLDHHLDHLAPLAWALDVPLIVTEEATAALARTYYPFVQLIYWDYTCAAHNLVHDFDVIVCSLPRFLFDEAFLLAQMTQNKHIHTIWCPHGNSDKGHIAPFMENLDQERVALVYGDKMIDFFKEKGVYHAIDAVIPMGNIRLDLYKEQRAHFDTLVEEEIACHLPANKRTILYAPTWEDREANSSYPHAIDPLLDTLPVSTNLIVKLHPNTIRTREFEVDKLMHCHKERHNVLFLTSFPPIYPLLNYVDIYVGDMSSIGYDMLTFNKPMYFLNHTKQDFAKTPSSYLFRCGIPIHHDNLPMIYEIIDKSLQKNCTLSEARKDVYDYTFNSSINKMELKCTLEKNPLPL